MKTKKLQPKIEKKKNLKHIITKYGRKLTQMYSKEHQEYLVNIKKRKRKIFLYQTSIIIIFLIVWQVLSDMGIINSFLFSSPQNIINTIKNFSKEQILNHIYITTYETIVSFSIATVIGLLIASIMWYNETFAKVINPYLTIINSLPKVALGPLIIIWFGTGIDSIIVMALSISLILSIINLYNSFIDTNKDYIVLLKSFNATKRMIFFKIIIPANKNNIFNSIKINISMSLIGLLPPVGEKIFFNKCYSRY